jgi:type I restriction enzyme M protein
VRAAPALQINFLQHVFTILKQHGRAAIVVPDNVLRDGAPHV